MKKILVLPLLLCLIFCSFLSLDKNLDEFGPDRTAYGSYDHRVVWGSYASSDKPRFHNRKSWTHAQCFIQSQICRHSWIASI